MKNEQDARGAAMGEQPSDSPTATADWCAPQLIHVCPRCGETHVLSFTALRRPLDIMAKRTDGSAPPELAYRTTHWAMCPTFNEPFLRSTTFTFGSDGLTLEAS